MAAGLQLNETVHVPRARLRLDLNSPNAFWTTSVVAQKEHGRSVRVTLPNGEPSSWVGSSAVHRNIGVYVVRFGDFDSEVGLLDPLAKSILQYLRVLLSDSYVRYVSVRSKAEFRRFWELDHAAYSHIVVVGHGSPSSLTCGIDGPISAEEFADLVDVPNVDPKVVLSLACETGRAGFAKAFSASEGCLAFIAPYHGVHGAVASQFCLTFLSHLLLEGRTVSVAFNRSRQGVPTGASFRHWRNGAIAGSGT